MSSNKMKTPAKVSVDMEKCLRVSKKILDMLKKKTKSSAEAYFAVRLVRLFLEERLGSKMTPDQEEELRKFGESKEKCQAKTSDSSRQRDRFAPSGLLTAECALRLTTALGL